MKNLIFGCFLVLILTQSCNKDEVQFPICEDCNFTCLDSNDTNVISNNCIDNWDCNFNVTAQSKVDLSVPLGLSDGDKNVFQMINRTEGESDIADDEYTKILVFELDESQDSFSAEDSELSDMKVHFKWVCFCPEVIFVPATSGCLQGKKHSDGTWFVQGYLDDENVNLKFDAQFMN